jgi:peptide methionine sulfoxide reductase MsrB
MNKFKPYLITCLLPFLISSCSYSSSTGWSSSDSESRAEEKERRRTVDRKTDRILDIGRTKDRSEARRQAKGEVFEEEFFRSTRP